jgi:anti-sigma regulatory factor (Ser/Thr protein kinase)
VVLSELVSNAVRHARPLAGDVVRVCWRVTADAIEIAVEDGGADARPRVRRPTWATGAGRGLRIVQRLSSDWGVENQPVEHADRGVTGQVVWAVVPRRAARATLPAHGA